MTDTFTLAHLSDVHLAPISGLHFRHWNTKRALGYLNWQRGRRHVHLRSVADLIAADALAHAPDHIAVTGDLANLGLPGEYAAALTWLEGLGDPDRVSVVPGNHDIYTGRLGGDSCLVTWGPFMRNSESWSTDARVQFPYVKTQGPVAFIGLCSAIPTPPFVAAGRLGDGQIAQLALALERLGAANYIRVVLIHHPPLPGQAPPQRALQDAAALADVLDQHGAELVLHGHNHREMLAWRRYSAGGIPVLGVPSASAGLSHKSEPLARYYLIRMQREDGALRINCETRGLTSVDGEVMTIDRRDLATPSV
ncbi:metallophosphoesterase [Hyphomicrobium sp. CS1GBMeth3]|uniref:metallophosphoesterase family protein n=1 Tax=Hyphomicrobium sp. CS1GBMeth3 TaxID=1892845 RepID=UPI000931E11C|nr:metallophosphoesterase [Hyphomicrobium sp. CS1GBMeth3]